MRPDRLIPEGPAVIGMMAAVLESGGSIDSAVRAVSKKGPPNSRELFTRAVRISDTKGSSSLGSALRCLLNDLPAVAGGYSRSLCMVLCAADSPDETTMSALLSDAADASLESVRILGESYGNSLTVPCMTVFGLGIMAPMILVSILPLMGIGGLFGNALDQRLIAVITLAIIPSVIVILILRMRDRNPFSSEAILLSDLRYVLPLMSSIPLGFAYCSVTGTFDNILLFSLLPACILTLLLMADKVFEMNMVQRYRSCLKETLSDLGNEMLSGKNYETGLMKSLRKGCSATTICSSFESELAYCRGDVETAIDRSVGNISSDVADMLKDIRYNSLRNFDEAGRLAIRMGRMLRDRDSAQRELEIELKSTTDMMSATAMFFAPMVLGMSIAMMEPLSEMMGYASLDGTRLLLSAYLVELCILISAMLSSLGKTGGLMSMVWSFCKMSALSSVIFWICSSINL